MKVTLLLADAAQAVNGKLYVLGGGWSLTGPDPAPMALAVKIEVPWDRANIKHRWRLELLDEDGAAVELVPTPEGGPQPLRIEGEFEAGRPPGLKPGTPLDVALALNLAPLPLPAGGRFVWRLGIDGWDEDWQVAFSTRPAAPAASSAI
ncbi:MAG: hypothetical protein ICV64_08815 [Thermoleophilia bacterium]|nr:hypothetical protein [Thermoleophilia bacterium]